MSIAVCDRCGQYVDGDSRRFPGFCSTACRDLATRDTRRRPHSRPRHGQALAEYAARQEARRAVVQWAPNR